jgi:hypothetical protein
MRLHSDFRDYYDHAIGFGIDEKVHYNRYQKELDITVKPSGDSPTHPRAGLLGFCGIVRPFIQLSRYDIVRDTDWDDEYTGKIIEEYFAFSFDEYKEKESDWYELSDDFGYSNLHSDTKLRQFFTDWRRDGDEVFRKLECPAWGLWFSRNSPNGILNPCLKDFGFERIKDAFAAFQEISMYLANILVEQKEIASVDDRHRIEQHGFDLKRSFRHRGKKSS